jgi:helix-turn-helix protein
MTPRCYTVAQLLDLLQLPRRTFFRLKRAGQLPFLEELRPRIGRRARYRADLVDRYLANQWGRPRAFAAARRAS